MLGDEPTRNRKDSTTVSTVFKSAKSNIQNEICNTRVLVIIRKTNDCQF